MSTKKIVTPSGRRGRKSTSGESALSEKITTKDSPATVKSSAVKRKRMSDKQADGMDGEEGPVPKKQNSEDMTVFQCFTLLSKKFEGVATKQDMAALEYNWDSKYETITVR